MIKNVVFDIGHVMVDFDAISAIYDKIGDMDKAKHLAPIIFGEYWGECDLGHVTLEEQIELTAAQSPEDGEFIINFLLNRVDMFHALKDTRDVVFDLAKAGVNMYYLSDTSFDVVAGLSEKLDFFKCFKGGVISCAEKAIKRDEDLKLFKTFLERFNLNPLECVFVDDLAVNIENAQKAGFNTVHLTDPTAIRYELLKFEGLEDKL